MPVIDSHHHFWDPARFAYPWMAGAALAPIRRRFAAGDLAPALAAHGVDATIAVQCCSDVAETEAILAEAADTRFVAGVVGWADLTDPAVGAVLDRLKGGRGGDKLVGIRHQVHDEEDPHWLMRRDVRRGLAAVLARDLAYDLLVRTRELPAAIDAVAAFPAGRFVLDHAAKPPLAGGLTESWRRGIADLAARPNVWCKVSGLVTEADWQGWRLEQIAPAVRHVVDSFGEDRVMFGSDWPVCLLAADYGTVKDLAARCVSPASAAAARKFWGGNAARAYRLALGDLEC